MKKLALLLVAIGPMIALSAVAQTPGAAERARVAGTVEKLDGDRLTVNVAGGQTQTVLLAADATIYGVEKRRLSDIKPGDFVASGGVRGTDGKIHAVEMRIFPESMRGVGEGQRPWDVKPEGVMTNAGIADDGPRHRPCYLQGRRVRICRRTRCPGAGLCLGRQNAAEKRCRRSDDCGEATRRQFDDQPRDRRKGWGQASNVGSSATFVCAALGVNGEGHIHRKKASHFPQELLDLFDGYMHGGISRRQFLDRTQKFAVGSVTAAALFQMLKPNYAWALQIQPDDKQIKVESATVPSPQRNGSIKGYLVRPAKAVKLPSVLVVHENRGLNPVH
jgi:hypothetical protein